MLKVVLITIISVLTSIAVLSIFIYVDAIIDMLTPIPDFVSFRSFITLILALILVVGLEKILYFIDLIDRRFKNVLRN